MTQINADAGCSNAVQGVQFIRAHENISVNINLAKSFFLQKSCQIL